MAVAEGKPCVATAQALGPQVLPEVVGMQGASGQLGTEGTGSGGVRGRSTSRRGGKRNRCLLHSHRLQPGSQSRCFLGFLPPLSCTRGKGRALIVHRQA